MATLRADIEAYDEQVGRAFDRVRSTLVAVAVLVAAACAPSMQTFGTASAPMGSWVESINAERAKSGVASIDRDMSLDRWAQSHAEWMADAHSLTHQDLDPILGEGSWSIVGENVGTGSGMVSIMGGFDASTVHRAVMLDRRFSRVGIGVVSVGARLWVSVVFGG